ncbi:MAG: hypothetical protein AAGG56_14005 [Pseudomonadota bacterium]
MIADTHSIRLRYGSVLAILFLLWLILTIPWWLQGNIIPYDSYSVAYATLRGVSGHLAAGDWPAWLPETFSGRPSLADPQSIVATPSLLTLAWFDPEPSIHAMDAIILTHLFIGAAAVAIWGLRRDMHPFAVLVAALVFAFGGSAMARLQHSFMVMSYAWIPVAILNVESFLARPNVWRAILTALVLAVLTVSRDHVAFLGHFVVLGAAIAWLAGQPDPLRSLRAALPWLAVSVVLWIAIVWLPLLSSVGMAATSTRPGFDGELVGRVLSLPWVSLFTLPFPGLFGAFEDINDYWGPGAANWRGYWFGPAIVQISIGVIPAVLLLWLGIARGYARVPGARFGAVVMALALAYAVGTRTPFFEIAFDTIPMLDLFQRPADATFLVNLGAAFALIGIVDSYLRLGVSRKPVWRLALESGAWLAVALAALAMAAFHGRLSDSWDAVLWPLLLAFGTAFLLLWGAAMSPRGRETVVAGLIALLAIDVSAHQIGTALNAQPAETAMPLTYPKDDPLAAWIMQRMEETETAAGPFRVELLGLGGSWQNASFPLGVDNILGYNPVRDARYQQATGARQNTGSMRNRRFGSLVPNYAAPFMDVLGVRYIVLGAPMETIDPEGAASFPPPLRIHDAYVYENANAVPRLVLVAAENARPHDPDAALESGDLPEFDPHREALIEGATPPVAVHAAPFEGRWRLVERQSDTWLAEVTTDRPAWLIFHEMQSPGWIARVNGERHPLHRANVLFQAVALEPGQHLVQFRYSPVASALSTLAR